MQTGKGLLLLIVLFLISLQTGIKMCNGQKWRLHFFSCSKLLLLFTAFLLPFIIIIIIFIIIITRFIIITFHLPLKSKWVKYSTIIQSFVARFKWYWWILNNVKFHWLHHHLMKCTISNPFWVTLIRWWSI